MNKHSGPPEGTGWKPNLSGNSIIWDGSSVVKNYGLRLENYYREQAILKRLEQLPLPHVLPGSRPGRLKMEYIDGIDGQKAIEAGKAGNVLYEMGRFLRQLHQIDPKSIEGILPGEGSVVVHGDYAYYNCIMDQKGLKLLAVIDWEVAYLGDPITDLAWCEWQFRNRFPQHEWAISKLFDGYGSTPDWHLRQEALKKRLDELQKNNI
ncbi:MAG: hypothetical protein PWP41_665 [Moorella sp. (in: firmicutes)]|nr:hypothetical protein [Moorella sp. (in: firmicutes)]